MRGNTGTRPCIAHSFIGTADTSQPHYDDEYVVYVELDGDLG